MTMDGLVAAMNALLRELASLSPSASVTVELKAALRRPAA